MGAGLVRGRGRQGATTGETVLPVSLSPTRLGKKQLRSEAERFFSLPVAF